MQLTREEAISSLLEEESIEMHGHASFEIYSMDTQGLTTLLNRVFEPIDLEDPYTVVEFADIYH